MFLAWTASKDLYLKFSDVQHGVGRHLLSLVEGYNCTAPAINEFPRDGFTREQRKQGWVLLHFIASCYLFFLLAIVCDDYFVPTIKTLCDGKDCVECKEDNYVFFCGSKRHFNYKIYILS